MKNSILRFCLFLVIIISPLSIFSKTIYYVKTISSGKADGSSWADASDDLQKMIDNATAGDEVWVAEGTYYPSKSGDPSVSFRLKEGINVYGGFKGDSPRDAIDSREKYDIDNNNEIENWEFKNETILSGDLGHDDKSNSFDNYQNNSKQIVSTPENSYSIGSLLDGLTITGASGGCGAYVKNGVTIKNSIFSYNKSSGSGAGAINEGIIISCLFNNNKSTTDGGGIYSYGIVSDSKFIDNECGLSGGGIYNKGSVNHCLIMYNRSVFAGGIQNNGSLFNSIICANQSTSFAGGVCNSGTTQNCLILNNESTDDNGGGIFNSWFSGGIINSTIVRNRAVQGGGIYSEFEIYNCAIWGNKAINKDDDLSIKDIHYVKNSAISGDNIEFNTENNFTLSKSNSDTTLRCPFFINPTNVSGITDQFRKYTFTNFINDWQSNFQSALINSGDNSLYNNTLIDIASNNRINGGIIDIGAFEQPLKSKSITINISESVETTYNYNKELNLPVTTYPTGLPIEYFTSDTCILKIANNNIIINGAGSCIITCRFLGTVEYQAATKRTKVTIKKAPFCTLYVNKTTLGDRTGTTWNNAFPTIEEAINEAQNYESPEIWIAQGTYSPPNLYSGKSWVIPNACMKIRGGFIGNETSLSERKIEDKNNDEKIDPWEYVNSTILCGDILSNDKISNWPDSIGSTMEDNAANIINTSNLGYNDTITVDGLTIQNGGMISDKRTVYGAGIISNYCYLKVINCTFLYNAAFIGGGLYSKNGIIDHCYFANNLAENSSGGATTRGNVSRCIFEYNQSNQDFGGLSVFGKCDNCLIQHNRAKRFAGGSNEGGIITNTIICHNIASESVGGISNVGTMNQCKIYDNISMGDVGGISQWGDGKIENSLIYNNQAKSIGGIENYSIINYCTICNNYCSENEAGVRLIDEGKISNSIVWGNISNTMIQANNKSTSITSCAIMDPENVQGYDLNNILLSSNNNNPGNGPNFKNPTTFAGIPKSASDSSELETADWHLSSISPCIDNANADCDIKFDYDGKNRPFNKQSDIGAYEFGQLNSTNGIIYVKQEATGKGDGSSWENATSFLQEAINCINVKEVWVAEGTYYPIQKKDSRKDYRIYSFIPLNGVNVYGSFTGFEKNINERIRADLDKNSIIAPWEFLNQTILSGDIDSIKDNYSIWPATIDSSMAGNTYHVVYQKSKFDTLTVWDGINIRGGNAYNADHITGSGIVALDSFKLMNCEIQFNHSESFGALNIKKGTIEKCKISYNKSDYFGGGIYAEESRLSDCLIENNNSINQSGGIMASNSHLTNCFIHNNSANENGGGSFSNSILENCSIANNKATEDVGGIIISGSTINNSKIFENESYHGNAGILVNENSTMKNCDVFLNKANGLSFSSAGVQNLGTVLNCRIFGNKTESQSTGAAGIWNGGTLQNSVIYNNEANGSIQCLAGGVYNQGTMINNTICNNKASLGAGNLCTYYNVNNCVIWGKDKQSSTAHLGLSEYYIGEIKNCAVMDGDQIANGFDGNITLSPYNSGNEDSNYPYFINPTTFAGYPQTPEDSIKMFEADWNISRKSALINKGYIEKPESLPDSCINGNKRIRATIDIGAYEFMLAISTNDPTLINTSGATMNGTVLTSDSSNIATYGFKYSEKKNFNPNTEGLEVLCNQQSAKIFNTNLNELKKFTPYYYVAYLKDTSGVYEFGDQKSFFTKNELKSRAGIIYVKQYFSGSGDGSSWENATGNLTEAITVSNPGNEIWIAEGIYRPNDLTPENTSNEQFFELKKGVNYYGGFKGYEASIDNRGKADNNQNGIIEAWEYSVQSILSADIDGIEDNYSNWPTKGTETTKNNAIHVLYQKYGTSGKTLVDGLILQGATSGGVTIRSNTSLINCIVRRNTNNKSLTNGGGVDNDRGRVISCLIDNNHITSPDNSLVIVSPGILTGGGIMNNYGVTSNCKVTNCSVAGYGVQGGGIQNWYGVVDHCEVASNVSSGNGGGIATYWGCVKNSKIYNNSSKNAALWAERNDTLINCVVYNNTASSGVGGAEGWGSTHNLTSVNNIGNSSTIKNAGLKFYIENNCLTTGNLNMSFPDDKQPIASSKDFKNPTKFVGTAQTKEERILLEKADWSLIATSSFINKGNNSLVLPRIISDIDGNKRIYGDKIDLGAYEFQGDPVVGIDYKYLNEGIQVFQNNKQQRLEIHIGKKDNYEIFLTDMLGRTVFKTKIKSGNELFINTSQLKKGIYLVSIKGTDQLFQPKKIIIE